jgi:adenylyltransferase/sulfurtransferase
MCEKMGKPWVDGAMENLLGEIAVYLPGEGPCYECTLTQEERVMIAQAASCRGIALRNLSMGKVPTTSTMGSIISAIEVQEGVKILHGDYVNSLAGKRLVVDCNVNEFYVTTSSRREGCEGHFWHGDITEVADFSARTTTAHDLLLRFEQDAGTHGFLRLGREIVTALECMKCSDREELAQLLSKVDEERVPCPKCGGARRVVSTNFVRGDEPYALWPLSRLGIPRLDVLEVRGVGVTRWYELTGDVTSFTASLQKMEGVDTVAKSA